MADKFLTQRFANAYPRWTAARREPSSVAQRFYSPIAEAMANEYATLKKQSQEFSLYREWLPATVLYGIQLEPHDFFPSEVAPDGTLQYTYPTVSMPGLGGVELTRVEDPADLFCQLPNFITIGKPIPVSSWVVYDSDTGIINDIDYPSRLVLTISGSDEYYLPGRGEFTSGRYFVDIEGYDLHGNEITDRVFIRDDGSYRTQEFFSKITAVRRSGFNGRIQLTIGSDRQGIEDPMFIGVDEENAGPLYYEVGLSGGRGVLYYYIDRELYGANYRRDGQILDLEQTEIWATVIRDSLGAEIDPVDLTIDWNTGYVVVLDSAGYVHWYPTGRYEFTHMSRADELTDQSYLEVQSLTSWSVLDEELKLFTRFQRPHVAVSSVVIQRISPTGIISYLQGDLTWGPGVFKHQYTADANIKEPVLTWKDFDFTAILDEVGEWEFYCETLDRSGATTITGMKVAVHAENSLFSFDTEVVSSAGETPSRLFIGVDGNLAVGTDEGNIYPLSCIYLYYYADTQNHMIWAAPLLNIDASQTPQQIEVVY